MCYLGSFGGRRAFIGGALLAVFGVAIAGCATIPDVDNVIDHPNSGAPPQIVGARGPLTERQSKAILARLDKGAGSDILGRHLAIEEAVAETPLVAGNRTRILRDGTETLRAMFDAMRGAKDHINLEFYIIEDVQCDGLSLTDLLIEKRREGVAVNIIYDSYGSSATPAAFFDRLRDAGVKFVDFNPINPLEAKEGYSPNDRDHRKILIVDGTTAIVGGVNLSSNYESHLPGKSNGPEGEPQEHWRDTDLAIVGPVVAQLQELFLEHWTGQHGPPLGETSFFPPASAKGGEVMRVIGSAPQKEVPRYYVTVLSAIRNAEKSIWLAAAYFVPTRDEKEDLIAAARRGVDVRLILPDHSDSPSALEVQHSHYADLLEAGVKIYETQHVVLHSKTMVIDGVWSVVGSSNFDRRSVLFNDEVDAIVLGRETASQLEAMFKADEGNAREIDLATWEGRSVGEKIQENLSRIWQDML